MTALTVRSSRKRMLLGVGIAPEHADPRLTRAIAFQVLERAIRNGLRPIAARPQIPLLDPVEILIETRPAPLRAIEKLETLAPFELVDLGQHTQSIQPDDTPALAWQVTEPTFPVVVGALLNDPSLRPAHNEKRRTQHGTIEFDTQQLGYRDRRMLTDCTHHRIGQIQIGVEKELAAFDLAAHDEAFAAATTVLDGLDLREQRLG